VISLRPICSPVAARGGGVSGLAQPAVFKIIAHEGASAPLTADDLRLIDPATEEWVGARLSRALAENADFTVVGVLGTPSVGKSELLSHLCGAGPCTALPRQRPASILQKDRLATLQPTRPRREGPRHTFKGGGLVNGNAWELARAHTQNPHAVVRCVVSLIVLSYGGRCWESVRVDLIAPPLERTPKGCSLHAMVPQARRCGSNRVTASVP
jgi:hypothetical protein